MTVTEEAIEAAWEILRDVPGWPPYMARVGDYITPGSEGAARQRQIEALKAADREADAMNRDVIRRVLEAAGRYIRADEREQLRRLLPYHVPCCENFAASVGDLINEHEDSP